MIYKLYQINFSNEEVIKINSRNPEFRPTYEAYLDSIVSGKCQKAIDLGLYKLVALVSADNLDDVFEIGNIGPEENIERVGERMHSVSVGDIIKTPEGEWFSVASFGFDRLEKFPEEGLEI